jgi:hypothetical protein
MVWLRWAFVCRFGRRCAKLEIGRLTGPEPPPDDLVLVHTYVCEGCGRHYREETRATEHYVGPR